MRRRQGTRLIAVLAMVSWLGACIGAGANTPVTPLSPERFPGLHGINLLGETIALPTDFDGAFNLVSMGFVQKHQQDIDSWIAAVPDLSAAIPELRFYEVPVIDQAGPLFRWWLNNGMRIGMVDKAARRRTITVYTDRDRFQQALDLPDLESIHTLLLDADADILWRHAGPITDDARQDLLAAVRRYQCI